MSGKINKGRKVWFSPTAQEADLDQAGFEAINDWVEVGNIVTVGETGANTNVVSQDYWGTNVTQKQTGVTNAGDPTIEVGQNLDDAGQNALRAVANNGGNYAYKIEDKLLPTQTTPVIRYNRGIVLGPVDSNGDVEGWNNQTFTFGNNQEQITVNAT